MNYADAIESEGYLDEQAEIAWRKASDEWQQFGGRLVPTSWGVNIRLNDEESLGPKSPGCGKNWTNWLPVFARPSGRRSWPPSPPKSARHWKSRCPRSRMNRPTRGTWKGRPAPP